MGLDNSTQLSTVASVIQELRVPAFFFLVGFILFSILKKCFSAPADVAVTVNKRKKTGGVVGQSSLQASKKKVSSFGKDSVRSGGIRPRSGQRQRDRVVGFGVGIDLPLSQASHSHSSSVVQSSSKYAGIPGIRDDVTDAEVESLFAEKVKDVVPMSRFRGAMNTLLHAMNPPMRITEISTDGHCLYKAISYLLRKHMGIRRTYQQLRQDTHDYIMEPRNHMGDFYAADGNDLSIEQHCAGIIRPFPIQQGDHLEMTALLNMYDFEADVWELDGRGVVSGIKHHIIRPRESDSRVIPTFLLAFDPIGKHFDVIEPLSAFRRSIIFRTLSRVPRYIYGGLLILLVAVIFRSTLISQWFGTPSALPKEDLSNVEQ